MRFNIFKTKDRFIGVKLFIQEDLEDKQKTLLSKAFFRELNDHMELDYRRLDIFHDVDHLDFCRDPATVYFMLFKKNRNFNEMTFNKKYESMFRRCWQIAELANFTWDKFDVNIYPVTSDSGDYEGFRPSKQS